MLQPEDVRELHRTLFAAKTYITTLHSLMDEHSEALTTKLDPDLWTYLKGCATETKTNINQASRIVNEASRTANELGYESVYDGGGSKC